MRYIFILFILFSSIFANTQNEILLLHSYNKGLKWSDGISQGLEDVLKSHPEYELSTEYMDSKKIDTKDYFDNLVSLYSKKFSNRQYKAIITADNYAFKFVLDNHKSLFNSAPIIFCGVENFDKKNIPIYLQRYVTGVVEYKDIRKNFKLIHKMIPDLDTLYIMSDDSFSSLAIKKQILNAAKEYKNKFDIIYDNNIFLPHIDKKLNKLPQNSAILFTSFYKDKYGTYIPYNELREFFKNSKIPIFALNKIHLGEGVIGGVMINPYDQGYIAGEKTFEIINGKIPLQIDISKPIPNTYFDLNILNKFNFKKTQLPIGTTIINQPKDFFEKNRELIDSLFLILPLLIILIIFLIINIYKRISLEITLVEQNKLDNVLLNNIKSSIFWKSKDDILLGCNNSLCELLDLSKDEIIGKHVSEIMPQFCKTISSYESFVDEIETKFYNKDNKQINALIRRKQYLNKNDEEAGVVTVINDITDIKNMEIQRKKDEQFIIQRSKLSEIGEMMTSVAHQWKAPLVEISTIAQEILYKRRKKGNISEEDTKEFVDEIMTQIQYMTKTIDDFRTFIKPSTTQQEFNVKEAINQLLSIIEHNLKYNYIKVDVSYDKEEEYIIYGYPNEFKQTILNIINNAKDSIIEKKVSNDFEGKISLHVRKEKDSICISIKDNGEGIKEDKLNSIFEPFVSSKENGDGFGLYMAKLIIEDKMGGSIKALKHNDGANILICVKNKLEIYTKIRK